MKFIHIHISIIFFSYLPLGEYTHIHKLGTRAQTNIHRRKRRKKRQIT